MCKGDAHGLDERRIRPIASMLANSALAATSLSGQRRLGRAWTGGPFVEMKWSTVCLMAACVIQAWLSLGILTAVCCTGCL